ncbi:MAG: hypothetical protein ACREAC_19755, partial [Blastocatellia bacterium]
VRPDLANRHVKSLRRLRTGPGSSGGLASQAIAKRALAQQHSPVCFSRRRRKMQVLIVCESRSFEETERVIARTYRTGGLELCAGPDDSSPRSVIA